MKYSDAFLLTVLDNIDKWRTSKLNDESRPLTEEESTILMSALNELYAAGRITIAATALPDGSFLRTFTFNHLKPPHEEAAW